MEDKKKIPVAKELTDELLEKVSGGTGVEEEDEDVPTYVDEWAAYEAIHCEGKECMICQCGLRVPSNVRNCPRCGYTFFATR